MTTKVRSGQTVLFIGDSITDCGRRATERPLGNGYVKLFADMMTVRELDKAVTIINKGIGGDTVVGLQNRWHDDVLRHRPDWLSIKIGINDLHGALNADNPSPIPPQRFEKAYTDILERTRSALPKCRILLIEPFYISTDKAPTSFRRSVLDLLPEYIAVVHKMGRTFDTRLVKTHALFQRLLKHHEPDTFCPEPVHPNTTGHLAIAEAVYQALEK